MILSRRGSEQNDFANAKGCGNGEETSAVLCGREVVTLGVTWGLVEDPQLPRMGLRTHRGATFHERWCPPPRRFALSARRVFYTARGPQKIIESTPRGGIFFHVRRCVEIRRRPMEINPAVDSRKGGTDVAKRTRRDGITKISFCGVVFTRNKLGRKLRWVPERNCCWKRNVSIAISILTRHFSREECFKGTAS